MPTVFVIPHLEDNDLLVSLSTTIHLKFASVMVSKNLDISLFYFFSQLRYDGLDMVAANLAKCVGLETTPLSPSSRLLGVMKLGLQEEKNGNQF